MLDLTKYVDNTIENLNKVIGFCEKKGVDLTKLKEFILKKEFDKKVLFIGGKQITGSFSPLIHTYSSLALDKNRRFFYTLLDLESSGNLSLNSVLNFIESDNDIYGANVTMPYKIDVFDLLKTKNKLDYSAKLVGAVNTISKVDGKILGFNTDIDGIVKPIKSKLSDEDISKIKKGYILGNGGAAMAAITGLIMLGITDINIFARSENINLINHFKDKEILEILKSRYGIKKDIKIIYISYDITKGDKISDYITETGILINTLPFGFKKELPKKALHYEELVNIKDNIRLFFDIVYDMNHGDTPLLKDFKENCIPTCDGRDMLIGQAIKGFELWTNLGEINLEKINKLLR